MWLEIGLGLVALFAGGEMLVRGASRLAARLGVSPLIIGLTIVGFGTSTPELVTSLEAAVVGAPGVALGNIVGSNICNILLILGIAAIMRPIVCSTDMLRRDSVWLVAASLVFAALAWHGAIGRMAGLVLVAGLVAYMAFLVLGERRRLAFLAVSMTTAGGHDASAPPARDRTGLLIDLALTAAGIAMVVFGGKWLVSGAIALAVSLDIPDTVIGVTVVAVGTSLPELATSVIAALKKQSDIALGNVIGSNIYNVLGIGGITALAVPLTVPDALVRFDVPVMLGATALLLVIANTDRRITRLEGAVLLAAYGAYLIALVP